MKQKIGGHGWLNKNLVKMTSTKRSFCVVAADINDQNETKTDD